MIEEIYKEREIYNEAYGYIVIFCGDEVIHDTIEDARAFIDEIEQNADNPDFWISY